MPHKGTYAGLAGKGVKKGSKLAGEIVGMSDAAKREAALEKQVAAKQKAMRTKKKGMSTRTAAKQVAKFDTPELKAKKIRGRAADLREKANAVDRSKTGNKRAAETYRQAARELLARIPKGK